MGVDAQYGGLVTQRQKTAGIIGAGPAGLIAAERLAQAGVAVTVYERMPSPARKLLMAGRGGLNLTHSEPQPDVAVFAGQLRSYADHPTTALLVVEVSDTTLSDDLTTKAELYATAGIAE